MFKEITITAIEGSNLFKFNGTVYTYIWSLKRIEV